MDSLERAQASRLKLPRWLHVPLPVLIVGAGVWLGYYSCDHFVWGPELFSPQIVGPAILLMALSSALVARKTPVGRRLSVVLLHLLIVVLLAILAGYTTPPMGKWLWEQRILKPRYAVLKELARKSQYEDSKPVTVEGYTFETCERTSQGALFYTMVLGGPFFSRGIFVPVSDNYQGFVPPQQGQPAEARSVTPTSVPGLFWFVTRR